MIDINIYHFRVDIDHFRNARGRRRKLQAGVPPASNLGRGDGWMRGSLLRSQEILGNVARV
jgi:hypothetical protein